MLLSSSPLSGDEINLLLILAEVSVCSHSKDKLPVLHAGFGEGKLGDSMVSMGEEGSVG